MASLVPADQLAFPSPASAVCKATTHVGALVVGGDHPGLAVARSLGRRGYPVVVLEDSYCISSFSKFVQRVIRVENLLDPRKTVDAVLEVGRRLNLQGWVLIPTRDETVAAFSQYRSELSALFTTTTGEWESIRWAWDKKLTYELAESLGIPCPKTFNPRSVDELASLSAHLPLAVKPAVKERFFYATGAKAWRAETPSRLQALYERASKHIRAEEILLQEIIPGDCGEQYSYCAFVKGGKPHSTLTAKRSRQRPREFGRAASYVETVELPEIERLAERFLKQIQYDGLVEIEFKRDPRDGQYKLLDVNARAWGFHGIGAAAGVDFAYQMFADRLGMPTERVRAGAGVGWIRVLTDLPTAFSDLLHGSLTLPAYWQSLRQARTEAVFAADDPLPSVGELLLLPYLIAHKYLPRSANQGVPL
jgi:predicted ATP-grasp superfamily ATP-dependent carboligase